MGGPLTGGPPGPPIKAPGPSNLGATGAGALQSPKSTGGGFGVDSGFIGTPKLLPVLFTDGFGSGKTESSYTTKSECSSIPSILSRPPGAPPTQGLKPPGSFFGLGLRTSSLLSLLPLLSPLLLSLLLLLRLSRLRLRLRFSRLRLRLLLFSPRLRLRLSRLRLLFLLSDLESSLLDLESSLPLSLPSLGLSLSSFDLSFSFGFSPAFDFSDSLELLFVCCLSSPLPDGPATGWLSTWKIRIHISIICIWIEFD